VRKRQTVGNRLDRGRDDEAGWLAAPLSFLANIGWGARDAVACVVGIVAAIAILVNALFLQSGPHPAPLFKTAALAPAGGGDAANTNTTNTVVVAVPRARPPEPVPVKGETPAAPRPPAEIMRAPKEASKGEVPKEAPKEGLKTAGVTVTAPTAPAPTRSNNNDAIAEVLSTSRRVMALQRALAMYGYGQLKPTGIVDTDTRAAIEKFERERKLPVTGQPSERVAKELTNLTGRPID
jgi:hypothetical protein